MTHTLLVVAWTENQNSDGVQVGCGPITSNRPWRSVQNFTEEATFTITGICWLSDMFTVESKADTL